MGRGMEEYGSNVVTRRVIEHLLSAQVKTVGSNRELKRGPDYKRGLVP